MSTKLFHGLIMGAPASGKGTISNRIIRYFDIKHLASGDILRNNIENGTSVGKEAKRFVEDGQLVPDKVMTDLIERELIHLSQFNWLLDGYPRTRNQALELFEKHPINIVLNLVVPVEIIIERVQGRWIHLPSGRIYNTAFNAPKIDGKDDITGDALIQRPDDKPEAVRKRLDIYAKTVDPVLNYYKGAGILKEFHGETSDEIWPQVFKYLQSVMKPKASL